MQIPICNLAKSINFITSLHAFVLLINEIDHLVVFTMSSFLFYDRFLCWEPLVYQGHISSKEHKFGTFESLAVIASFR